MALPAFDQLATDLPNHTIKFTLSPILWENADEINRFFSPLRMNKIKFFNDDGSSINSDIRTVPDDKGGIYFFILKNDVLPDLSSHIMYIGRAHLSDNQNLRKRCREYFTKYYKDHTMRPHIYNMLNKWTKHLYLYFIELTDNNEIDEIEKKLINNIVPPFNHDIPSTTIRQVRIATQAF